MSDQSNDKLQLNFESHNAESSNAEVTPNNRMISMISAQSKQSLKIFSDAQESENPESLQKIGSIENLESKQNLTPNTRQNLESRQNLDSSPRQNFGSRLSLNCGPRLDSIQDLGSNRDSNVTPRHNNMKRKDSQKKVGGLLDLRKKLAQEREEKNQNLINQIQQLNKRYTGQALPEENVISDMSSDISEKSNSPQKHKKLAKRNSVRCNNEKSQEPHEHETSDLDEREMNMIDNLVIKTGGKRKKIQQKNCIDWLKSRYRRTTNLMYLYYPEELIKKGELKRIFLNFDADESKAIDLVEFMNMFIDNYIDDVYSTHQSQMLKNLEKKNHVKHIFDPGECGKKNKTRLTKKQKKVIEEVLYKHFKTLFNTVTNKKYLSLVDFVSQGINKESVELFTNFMRDIKNHKEFQNSLDFLPMSFDDMVEFLSYRSKREGICLNFEKEQDWITKYRHCLKLFDLQENQCNERGKVINRALQKNNRVKEDDVEYLTEDDLLDQLKKMSATKIERADSIELDCVKGDEILEKFQNERRFTYNDAQITAAQKDFNISNLTNKDSQGGANEAEKKNLVGNLMGGALKKKGQDQLDKEKQTKNSIASLMTKKSPRSSRKPKGPSIRNTLVSSILMNQEDLSSLKLDIKKKPPSLFNQISKGVNNINDLPTETNNENVTFFRVRKDKFNLMGDTTLQKKYKKRMEEIKHNLDNKIELAKSTAKSEVETFFNEVDSQDPYHDHSKYINKKKSHIIKNHDITLSSFKSQTGFYGKQAGMYATTKTGFKMYNSTKNFASHSRLGFNAKTNEIKKQEEERKQNIFDQIKTRINNTQKNRDPIDPFNPAFAKTKVRVY